MTDPTPPAAPRPCEAPELVTLKVEGEPFRCPCGCNVFRLLPHDHKLYACNACDEWYQGHDD